MPTYESLVSQIKTLEVQLAILKAQLGRLSGTTSPKAFVDLYGLFAGKISSAEEEINAVQCRFDWEDEEIK
jgi:hypothetical protein